MKKIGAFIVATAVLATGCTVNGSVRDNSSSGSSDPTEVTENDINVDIPEDQLEFMSIYSNMAWDFQYDGMMIQGNGDVYLFNTPFMMSGDDPKVVADALRENFEKYRNYAKPAGTVDIDFLKEVYSEAVNIDPNAELIEEHQGYDMGQRTLYFVDKDYNKIEINSSGDYDETPVDASAKKTAKLLKGLASHTEYTDKEPYSVSKDPTCVALEKMPDINGKYLRIDNYKDLKAALREWGATIPGSIRDIMINSDTNDICAYIRIEEGSVDAKAYVCHGNTRDFVITDGTSGSKATLMMTLGGRDDNIVSEDGSKWEIYKPSIEEEDDNSIYTDLAMSVFAMTCDDRNNLHPDNIIFAPLGLYKELLLLRDCQTGDSREELENALGEEPSIDEDKLIHGSAIIECGEYEPLEMPKDKPFEGTYLEDELTSGKISDFLYGLSGGFMFDMSETISGNTPLSFLNVAALSRAWAEPFKGITALDFTDKNGNSCETEFLVSDGEDLVENDCLTGFIKDYEGGDISFMAFMPSDGSDARKFASKMTSYDLTSLYNSRSDKKTAVNIPVFACQSDLEHEEALYRSHIMEIYNYYRAFLNNGAYVDKIVSCSYLDIVPHGSGMHTGTDVKIVDPASDALTFDRPFIVAVMDNDTGCPLMLGLIENTY